tara:strand:- start:310 stop:423 length:114 start_codon:yes stop_codon:yes gene_type:complete
MATPPPVSEGDCAARIRTTANGVPHILAASLALAAFG